MTAPASLEELLKQAAALGAARDLQLAAVVAERNALRRKLASIGGGRGRRCRRGRRCSRRGRGGRRRGSRGLRKFVVKIDGSDGKIYLVVIA